MYHWTLTPDTSGIFRDSQGQQGPPKMVSGIHTIPISIRDSYGNSMRLEASGLTPSNSQVTNLSMKIFIDESVELTVSGRIGWFVWFWWRCTSIQINDDNKKGGTSPKLRKVNKSGKGLIYIYTVYIYMHVTVSRMINLRYFRSMAIYVQPNLVFYFQTTRDWSVCDSSLVPPPLSLLLGCLMQARTSFRWLSWLSWQFKSLSETIR